MAQTTVVTFVDDLDNSTDDVQTVRFHTVDGTPLEIDLSKENRATLEHLQAEFADGIAGFVESARKPTEPVRSRTRRRVGASARPDRDQLRAIREWAKDNGHVIADRGRIPKTVIDAFQATH